MLQYLSKNGCQKLEWGHVWPYILHGNEIGARKRWSLCLLCSSDWLFDYAQVTRFRYALVMSPSAVCVTHSCMASGHHCAVRRRRFVFSRRLCQLPSSFTYWHRDMRGRHCQISSQRHAPAFTERLRRHECTI